MLKSDFRQWLSRVVLGSVLMGGLLFNFGCGRGPTGPTGPEGPAGPTGATGVVLLKEYTGTATMADFSVDIPEILGRRSTTYVETYWALAGAPDIWTPMADGWTNPGDPPLTSRTMGVSWTFGKVYLAGMKVGDLYLIRVFQNN